MIHVHAKIFIIMKCSNNYIVQTKLYYIEFVTIWPEEYNYCLFCKYGHFSHFLTCEVHPTFPLFVSCWRITDKIQPLVSLSTQELLLTCYASSRIIWVNYLQWPCPASALVEVDNFLQTSVLACRPRSNRRDESIIWKRTLHLRRAAGD